MYPPYTAERKWECFVANSLQKGDVMDGYDPDGYFSVGYFFTMQAE